VAVEWYRKVADYGYAGAQYNLGLMLLAGRGVSHDLVRAYMWFELAAAAPPPGLERERILTKRFRGKGDDRRRDRHSAENGREMEAPSDARGRDVVAISAETVGMGITRIRQPRRQI
jgi:hypothetical protein